MSVGFGFCFGFFFRLGTKKKMLTALHGAGKKWIKYMEASLRYVELQVSVGTGHSGGSDPCEVPNSL